MKQHRLRIRTDGILEYLSPPPIPLKLEKQTRTRYSEIVPLNPWLCLVFRLLRFLFGEAGWVSGWTRRWKCVFLCHILLGRVAGVAKVSRDRDSLLKWEHDMFFGNHEANQNDNIQVRNRNNSA